MTRRTAATEKLASEERLELSTRRRAAARRDRRRAGRGHQPARVDHVAAEVTERVAPGQVFMAFHFPEALANALTS